MFALFTGAFIGNGEKSGVITFGSAGVESWTGFYVVGLREYSLYFTIG